MSRIAVLGSGAWGTALALTLHRRGGHDVVLWAHSDEFAQQINDAGENTQFLPGFPLPGAITVTGDCAAVAPAEIVVSVIPSEFLRSAFTRIGPHLHAGQIVLSATKGVEDRTLLRMTEVIGDCLRDTKLALAIGALSGPSFVRAPRGSNDDRRTHREGLEVFFPFVTPGIANDFSEARRPGRGQMRDGLSRGVGVIEARDDDRRPLGGGE